MQWVPRPHHCHLKLNWGTSSARPETYTRRRRAIFHDAAAARFSSGQACSQPPVKPSPGHYIIGREQSAAPGYRVQRPLSDGVEVDVGLDEGMACHPWSPAWARLRHFTALKNFKLLMAPASTPHHATGRLRGPGDGQWLESTTCPAPGHTQAHGWPPQFQTAGARTTPPRRRLQRRCEPRLRSLGVIRSDMHWQSERRLLRARRAR